LFIEIAAAVVVHNDDRELLDDETEDRFGSKIEEGNDFGFANPLTEKGGRSFHGTEVDRPVPHDGIPDILRASPFADHAAHTGSEDRRGVGIHTGGGGRAGGPDRPARAGRRRSAVVDDLPSQIHRERLLSFKHLHHPFVGGVTCGKDDSGEEHLVADPQAFDLRLIEWGP